MAFNFRMKKPAGPKKAEFKKDLGKCLSLAKKCMKAPGFYKWMLAPEVVQELRKEYMVTCLAAGYLADLNMRHGLDPEYCNLPFYDSQLTEEVVRRLELEQTANAEFLSFYEKYDHGGDLSGKVRREKCLFLPNLVFCLGFVFGAEMLGALLWKGVPSRGGTFIALFGAAVAGAMFKLDKWLLAKHEFLADALERIREEKQKADFLVKIRNQ